MGNYLRWKSVATIKRITGKSGHAARSLDCFSQVIAEHESETDHVHEIHSHDHDDDNERPDEGTEYYRQWFKALERILASKGIVDSASIDVRHQYLRDNPVPHDHVARREPVCIA
ncbi:hypothetical protein AB4Z52_35575 [Rhizobium sp. 2YAF20]|uniref:hypothetical protein n=1 Tax=Rhizobium sp. 2YAF20 TaxID=3233027 RepID=UPI003F9C90F1